MIWSLGLRGAVVDANIFSPLPYRAGQQAALVVEHAPEIQVREIQRVAVGVNAFWSSSRGKNPEGSYAELPPGCLWLGLVKAAFESDSAQSSVPIKACEANKQSTHITPARSKTPFPKSRKVKLRMIAKQPFTAYRPTQSRLSLRIIKKTVKSIGMKSAAKKSPTQHSKGSTSQAATKNPILVEKSPQKISSSSVEESVTVAESSRRSTIIPWPTLPPHTFLNAPGSRDFKEAR